MTKTCNHAFDFFGIGIWLFLIDYPIKGQQSLIHLRPSVPKKSPRASIRFDIIQVQFSSDGRFSRPVGFCQKLACAAGDKGRAVEGNAGIPAAFCADAVGGDDRNKIGSGMTAHADLPGFPGIPQGIRRL